MAPKINIKMSEHSAKNSAKDSNSQKRRAISLLDPQKKPKNVSTPKSSSKRTGTNLGFDNAGFEKMSAQSRISARTKQSAALSKGGKSIKSQKNVASGDAFAHLCKEIEENHDDWDMFVQGIEPYDNYFNVLPCNFGMRLSAFEKLLLIKIFKPEKIAESITMYLEEELGPDFSTSPVSSIENLFKASDCGTPIIFVLSQGVDPTF